MKPGTIWLSECGQYVAQYVGTDVLDVVVYAADGSACWVRGPARAAAGERSSVPRVVSSWSNHGRSLRSGRWVAAFELTFVDVDTSVPIVPFTGNAIIREYHAEFRRRLRWMPKALRAAKASMPDRRRVGGRRRRPETCRECGKPIGRYTTDLCMACEYGEGAEP